MVYIVELLINVLSIDCCKILKVVVFVICGIGNVDSIDFIFLCGKQVILVMDNDELQFVELNGCLNLNVGICVGLKVVWMLYECLIVLDILVLMVDYDGWEYNDVNDIFKVKGVDELCVVLSYFELWLIFGLSGEFRGGCLWLFLLLYYWYCYGYFCVKLDFMQVFSEKIECDVDGNEKKILIYKDVVGFWIVVLLCVMIVSLMVMMMGDEDSQLCMLFVVLV